VFSEILSRLERHYLHLGQTERILLLLPNEAMGNDVISQRRRVPIPKLNGKTLVGSICATSQPSFAELLQPKADNH
jgi:hypothetical protein